jgi:hypothetical protein
VVTAEHQVTAVGEHDTHLRERTTAVVRPKRI